MTCLDKVRTARSTLGALMKDHEDADAEATLVFRSFMELAQAVEAIDGHVGRPLVAPDFQPGDQKFRPGPML